MIRTLVTEEIYYGLIHEFKLNHNATEAIKNIYCTEGEGAVDHCIVTRWFKKFYWGCENHHQTKTGRPKALDFKAVNLAIEANPVSSTRRVSGELGIS